MPKALVVLSGGQDSTTCLFYAKSLGYDELHTITFDYGQNHAIEIQSAAVVSFLAGAASHEVIRVPDILKSTSPLTNAGKDLEQYANYEEMDAIIGDRVEKTFVPMRNALFLAVAFNRAVDLGCQAVFTGVCQEDNANYPDCRLGFILAAEQAFNRALTANQSRDDIHLVTPLMNKSKATSVKDAFYLLGEDAVTALAYTHTAYDGKYPPTGNDHASLLRAQGFLEAGLPDPLVVRAAMEGLMDLPVTPNYEEGLTLTLVRDSIRAKQPDVDAFLKSR